MLKAALLILACAAVAGAQTATTPSVEILTPAMLRSIADTMPHAASRTAQLGRGAGYTYALTQRDSAGGEESHMAWTDVFVIQSGGASLLYGGTADGAKETTPGEWRGGIIRGGTTRALHPGDVVVIPAGVPHQMLLERGQRVAYLAFKVAAPSAK